MDEIGPYSSSTLGEEERTAMEELVEKKAPLCSICDGHFRNFVQKHKLGVGEVLTSTVGFVLVDPP